MTGGSTGGPRPHPGEATFGPGACRECAYPWATPTGEARRVVAGAPGHFRAAFDGRPPAAATRKPDDGTWSPAGYVWHLADWFRIQGQRIHGIRHHPGYRFVPLGAEPHELGGIFRYDDLPLVTRLWALEQAARAFDEAADGADPDLVFDAGSEWWTVGELVVWVGHEATHHLLDVERGLGLRPG